MPMASKTDMPRQKGGSPTALDRLIERSLLTDQSASATLNTLGRSEASGILSVSYTHLTLPTKA